MNACGWLGAIYLAFCGLGPVIEAIRDGYTTVPWSLLIPWYLGEILVLIPVAARIKSKFLVFNYVANILLISILIYYKIIGG